MNQTDKDTLCWRDKRSAKLTILFCLTLIFMCTMIGSLIWGSVDIPLSQMYSILSGQYGSRESLVIWNIRMPRNIVGALVGANLAVSGAILQAIMKNPLADPGIVGVSSGAGLVGVIMLVLFPHLDYLLTPVSFFGALLAGGLIYALAWKNGIRPVRVILAGVAVSALFGSGISSLLIFYSDRIQGALIWMVGGLSARSWPQVDIIYPYTIIGILTAIAGAKQLNVMALGDETAKSLGMRIEWVRFLLTAVAALLAAAAVSVSGLIGFVGLVVPHIMRMIIGENHHYLLPASAIGGAIIMVLSDTLGRILFAPIEIPVGILMAFLGAPFFLYILRRSA